MILKERNRGLGGMVRLIEEFRGVRSFLIINSQNLICRNLGGLLLLNALFANHRSRMEIHDGADHQTEQNLS